MTQFLKHSAHEKHSEQLIGEATVSQGKLNTVVMFEALLKSFSEFDLARAP